MSELCSIRRMVAVGVTCAMLLAGWPQAASAKQDWLGWLEEFSGPGPFGGRILGRHIGIGEISIEFLCLNVSETRSITAKGLIDAFPGLNFPVAIANFGASLQTLRSAPDRDRDFTDRLRALGDSLRQLQDRLKDSTAFESADLAPSTALVRQRIESLRGTTHAEDQNAFAAYVLAFNKSVADYQKDSSVLSAAVALGIGRIGNANVETRRKFEALGRNATKFSPGPTTIEQRGTKFASCRRGRLEQLRAERLEDSVSTRTAVAEARQGDAKEHRAILERRDWQTGLVIGYGNYLSHENRIFPPLYDAYGNALDAPELRVQPLEILAHAKLSPAIDVGAGLGLSFFDTDFHSIELRPGQSVGPTKKAAFYYVPLSVVVRPAGLFWPDNKWASSIGYRVSARRFGNLEAKDFGNPGGTFKQSGEMIWGTSLYVDLYTLIGF